MNNPSHTFKLLMASLVRKSWLIAISILVLAIVISGVIIVLPRSQDAHAVPASAPMLRVIPGSQAYFSNTKLRTQGSNYPNGETVKVYWNYKDANNPGTLEGSALISTGVFTVSFFLPLAPTGTYTIASVGQTSGVITTTFQLLPNMYALPRATGIGSRFTITGQAFGAGELVNIYWNSTGPGTGTLLTTGTGDTTGSFQVTVNVPSNATYGKNPIFGIGQTTNATATAKIIVYRPTLALAPLSGSTGTQLSISAYGFQSNEKVSAYWSNTNISIFSTHTTPNGYVPIKVFTIPEGTAPGSYPVKIVGTTSHLTITNMFAVVAPGSTLSASSGPVGMRVRVSGQGYTPAETVNIFWGYSGPSSGKNVATATVGISGTFRVSFLVPTANTGNHVVAAVGATSNSVTQKTFAVTTGLAANPTKFAPGQSTTVSGTGFQTNEVIKMYWESASGTHLSSPTADANGNVSQAITIPTSASPGSHNIVGVGQTSNTTFSTAIIVDTMWNDFGFGTAHLRENPFENSVSSGNVGSLQPRWSAPIGSQSEGAPSPVYYNGLVYIATLNGVLKAYDATTGAVQWQFNTNTTFANLTSPVIDPATSTLFFGTLGFLEEQDHGVPSPSYMLDAQTGNLIWSLIIPGDDYAFPTLLNNTIYVGLANEGGGSLLAIDETSGKINWQYHANGGVWGAVGIDNKTGNIFTGVGNPGNQVLSLNATTGTLNWQHTIASPGNDDDIGAAMAVANSMVYVDSKNGNMYALDEHTGTEVWKAKIGANSQGNVSSPVVSASGVLYVGSLNGTIYALNAMNGSLVWKVKTNGEIYSSPALANGVVYIASNDGKIYAFDAASGQQKWFYNTAQPTFSSPILVNGWLYCASTDGDLYAFSL